MGTEEANPRHDYGYKQVVGALYNPRGRPSYYSHLRFIVFQTAFWLLTAKYLP